MKIMDFKQDHKQIITALMKVKKQDSINKESLNDLNEIKNTLIEHLKKEDQYLYPFLLRSTNIDVVKTTQIFQKEMETVLPSVLDFFEKYASEDIENELIVSMDKKEEFKNDLDVLIKVLFSRVGQEEKFLYPLFE